MYTRLRTAADPSPERAEGRYEPVPLSVQYVWEEFDAGLRAFIVNRVGAPEAAEDVLQDVYLKIHTQINTLRDEERVRAWVYQVARNTVYDHYRASAQRAAPWAPTAVWDDDSVEAEADLALQRSVASMLDCLSPEHREALVLTEYDGLTQSELAARLGISVSGAKSRVQRARSRLKAALLECCEFELDRRGRVMNYYRRSQGVCTPDNCGECGAPRTIG